jgi:UDP-N-acetylglucosamine 2-epimerase (non-hydrolysing)
MNRQMTGRIATYHFAPTVGSRRNLLDENVDPNRILVTGNTVIDALLWVADKIRQDVTVKEGIEMKLSQGGIDVDNYSLWENSARDLVLITGHRRENFGKPFEQICAGILELAKRCPSVDFLYPVHPNPRVKEVVDKYLLSSGQHNILLIEPVDYDCFVALMRVAKVILTDSGGVQEEAPSLGKPVLVMRDTTERPEAVNEGTVKLIGAVKDRIVDGVSELLECEEAYDKMAKAKNPYGDGTACNKIVEFLETIESR